METVSKKSRTKLPAGHRGGGRKKIKKRRCASLGEREERKKALDHVGRPGKKTAVVEQIVTRRQRKIKRWGKNKRAGCIQKTSEDFGNQSEQGTGVLTPRNK